MSDDFGKQLRQALHDAAKNHIYGQLKTPEDREELAAIERRREKSHEDLTRCYHEQYDARVDATRAQLLKEASRPKLNHAAPAGSPPRTEGDIERQAHRQVQLAHKVDLERVGQEASEALGMLLKRASVSNPKLRLFVDMAAEATRQRQEQYFDPERRTGIDRRARQDRRAGPSRSRNMD